MTQLIEFSEEQGMLLETAEDFCRRHSPLSEVRQLFENEAGFDPSVWREMTELGWLAITIPEEYGGLGLTLADVAPIAESMGRHLLASPFQSTTLATQVITSSASDVQKAAWLPGIAEGQIATTALFEEDGNWHLSDIEAAATVLGDTLSLSGRKCFVLDAASANLVLASVIIDGQSRIVAIPADQIPDGALQRESVIDETRRSFQLELDGIKVPLDNLLPDTDFDTLEQTALLLLVAEMAGGQQGVLEVIVDYLKTRKQFDKYIGSYQALKHPTVGIMLASEATRSHLYHAATALAAGDDNAEIALLMAKAQGSEAFAHAGDRAVQFHGGFGFTWECDAQLFLRRALWCQYQFGDQRYHRQRLAPLLLD